MSFARYRNTANQHFGSVGFWRIVLGVVTAGCGLILGSVVVFIGLELLLVTLLSPETAAEMSVLNGFDGPHLLTAYLFAFTGVHLALALIARKTHNTRYARFFSIVPTKIVKPFTIGVALVVIVNLVLTGATFVFDQPVPNLPFSTWILWLAPALLGILIQSSAEEVLFRGYLQTMLAAKFRSPVIWLILPALLFGAMHWQPAQYGENAIIVVFVAAVMGLLLGDITAQTGNILTACGIHFANNAISVLFVGMPGPLGGLSLYIIPLDPANTAEMRLSLLLNLAVILGLYAIYRIWLWRRSKVARAIAI